MRRAMYLGLILLPASVTAALMSCGGGGPSLQDACNQAMAATCQRAFDCGGAAALASFGDYATVADCTKGMQAAQCSNRSCPAGYSYHSDQAPKCIDALRNQQCAEVTSDTMPAACEAVCSPGGGSTGGSGGGFGAMGGGVGGGIGGVGGGAGGSGGGGTLSAQDACKLVVAALCERTGTCQGADGLAAIGNYTSVASCTTGEQAQSCATPADAGCTGGKTYHGDQGKKCADEMATLSCSDLASFTLPTSCGLVCQ